MENSGKSVLLQHDGELELLGRCYAAIRFNVWPSLVQDLQHFLAGNSSSNFQPLPSFCPR